MKKDNNWMLITYYCPTHGDAGKMEDIEIERKEICKTYLENNNIQKHLEI